MCYHGLSPIQESYPHPLASRTEMYPLTHNKIMWHLQDLYQLQHPGQSGFKQFVLYNLFTVGILFLWTGMWSKDLRCTNLCWWLLHCLHCHEAGLLMGVQSNSPGYFPIPEINQSFDRISCWGNRKLPKSFWWTLGKTILIGPTLLQRLWIPMSLNPTRYWSVYDNGLQRATPRSLIDTPV